MENLIERTVHDYGNTDSEATDSEEDHEQSDDDDEQSEEDISDD